MPQRPNLPRYSLDDYSEEPETKTICPACRGSGKKWLVPVGPSTYRFIIICDLCDGNGMCTASKASGFRRRAIQSP